MSLIVLQHLFYIVIGVAIVAYVILDGFDLGVGCIHLFARNDYERRIMLNSIGPIWDGNEVWLVIIAGGLFAGFPDVYAALFSGFYLLWMILLAGIIFRAVAIEFRSKTEARKWRSFWDFMFFLSSIGISFLIGILLGNVFLGVPINQEREIWITFGELFSLFPILLGVFSIALLSLHGELFILLKTESVMQKHFRSFLPAFLIFFTCAYILITIYTLFFHQEMVAVMQKFPILYLVPFCVLVSVGCTWFFSIHSKYGWAFIFSCLTIFFLFSTFEIGLYPNLLISSINPEYSLNLYNSSSEALTLKVALIIVLIGVPLVLAYGGLIYYIFRQKTRLHEHSY